MRESRVKAKVPAVMEALSLWRPFRPVAPISGPLAEKRGVFWIALDPQYVTTAISRLQRLGYSLAVDEVLTINNPEDIIKEYSSDEKEAVRWRGVLYNLVRVYQENREGFRNRAADKRIFLLENDAGEVRPVKGYRGDGSILSRRGLPVEDARLLVNLVSPQETVSKELFFLDPFAGTGGIIIEALEACYTVVSLDTDKRLRHGLKALGARHLLADASHLPFAEWTFTAIATEPPYHRNTGPLMLNAFGEFHRVLKTGGRLSMLVAQWQAEPLLKHSATHHMRLLLASPVNRKGTEVVVLAWEKVA